MSEPDFLDWVEREVAAARLTAARAYDRCSALLHVRGVAQEAAAARGVLPVRLDDLWAVCGGVEGHAALQAAFARLVES